MQTLVCNFKMNIKQFIHYLENQSFSPNTIKSYASDLKQFFSFTGNSDISRESILAYKKKINNKGASTINRNLSAIRKYLDFIGIKDLVLANDFITIQSSYSSPTNIDKEDTLDFLKDLRKWGVFRDYCIAVVIANTGLRISEVLNLKLAEVANLSISKSIFEITIVGKGNKQRKVIFNTAAIKVIKEYIKVYRKDYRFACKSNYVFVSNKAEKLNPATIQRTFKEFSNDIHPHALRHFFATNAYENGRLNLRQLQEQLGHSSLNTVQKYTHPSRKAMEVGLNGKSACFI